MADPATPVSGAGGRAGRILLAALLLGGVFPVDAGAEEAATYARVTAGRELVFPRDHGSHPEFKIEWWYLTGHLFAGERRFGFESTFFRLAQRPGGEAGDSPFDVSQVYMAHMALSDLEKNRFFHEERFNREGWNAWARVGDLDVRNGNWTLRRREDGRLELEGSIQSKITLSLELTPEKPHVIFGENGISVKGRDESAASYYITWPRLSAEGSLRLDGEESEVTGSAWMDHEISSSQLDDDQVGWDWLSVQFEDGRELMLYVLRLRDGGTSGFSQLVWIDGAGELTHRRADEFTWTPGGIWKSEVTGAEYPIRPRFSAVDPESGKRRSFRVIPLMENQEMQGKLGGVPYWEGACDVVDEKGVRVGRAYLELAGYVDGLNERLR